MQFSKAAVFRAGRQASPLTAPRASPGAFRSQALATGAGVQYRQLTNIASTALSFIANERNAGVASKTAAASAEATLAWETAYQKAKVEQPDSPESWTQIADKAGNESVSGNVEKGDPISNILFGEDDIEEKIGVSLTKLKAAKAGEVQKGRVNTRRRDFAKAARLNMERTRTELTAIGVDVANVADSSATSVATIRKSANDSFDVFSNSLMKDSLIPSALKTQALTGYISDLTGMFVDHMIDTDPANAARHIELVNSIANNGAYGKHINKPFFEQQKQRILKATVLQNSLVKLDIEQRSTKDWNSRQIMLNNITKSIINGDVPSAMSALSKLREQTSALKEETYIDAQGNRVLMWRGENAKRLEASYDSAALIIMGPMYNKLASALTGLVGDEGVDPKTHDNAERFLLAQQRDDPSGFFRLLATLSPAGQNIVRADLQRPVDSEKASAGDQLRRQEAIDLKATTKVSVANVISQLQLLVVSDSFLKLTPSNKARELDVFLKNNWSSDIVVNAKARGEGVLSGPEIGVMLLTSRDELSKAVSKALEGSLIGVETYDVVKKNPTDFQLLFQILANSSLPGDSTTSHRARLNDRKKVLVRTAANDVKLMEELVGQGQLISAEVLDSGLSNAINLARFKGSAPSTIEALKINWGILAHSLAAARESAARRNAELLSGGDPREALVVLRREKISMGKTLDALTAPGYKSGVTFDLDGQKVAFVKLPVDLARDLFGDAGGGGLYKLVTRAMRKEVENKSILISALDGQVVFDPNNAKYLPKLFGIDTKDENSDTLIDRALRNPNSADGAGLLNIIAQAPVLGIPLAVKLNQRLGAAFAMRSGPERRAMAKPLWTMSKVVSNAADSIIYKLGPNAIPEDMNEIRVAFGRSERNLRIAAADYNGRLWLMQQSLSRVPDEPGAVIGVSLMTPGDDYNKEQVEKIIRGSLNMAWRANPVFQNRTIIPDENDVEYKAVVAMARDLVPEVSTSNEGYEAYSAEEFEKISVKLQDDGVIGYSTVGLGQAVEYAKSFYAADYPMDHSILGQRALEIKAAWGADNSLYVKGIMSNTLIALTSLHAMHERGLPASQMRAALTEADINAIFSRYDFGGENAQLSRGPGRGFREVSAPHKKFVDMINEWSIENLGEKFFYDKFSREELRGATGEYAVTGIFASRTRSWWNSLPKLGPWTPNANSITPMIARMFGDGGPVKTIAGTDGVPRRAYNVVIRIPGASERIDGLDEAAREAAEEVDVSRPVAPTTVTLRDLTFPGIDNLGTDLPGQYFRWFDTHNLHAMGARAKRRAAAEQGSNDSALLSITGS